MSTLSTETKNVLINRRIILITAGVNEQLFDNIERILAELIILGSPDVVLYINTAGGDVSDGLDIYDLIKMYPGETTGIVFRQAASMGAIILQACTRRLAARHSDILIHHISRNRVSLDVFEDTSGVKMRELHESLKKRQQYLYDILVERTGKSLDEIVAACKKDTPMTAEEAKSFGLVDQILTREDMIKYLGPTPKKDPATAAAPVA